MRKPRPPSLSPELLPPPERSTENTSSLFRCFQAPPTHLQKSVMPKSNICSLNPSPPAGLMYPWTPRMRRAGHDYCPNTFSMSLGMPSMNLLLRKNNLLLGFPTTVLSSSQMKMGSREQPSIMIHF